jgi:hypothetical protein
MTCSLCGTRKARRACPGVGHDICAVCCGTKRLVQINCPPTCGYLQAARLHPPAVEQRRQQDDRAILVASVRDLTGIGQEIFFLLLNVVRSQAADPLRPLVDADVAEAADALASTYETAARGVIYEHPVGSMPAQRLLLEWKTALKEAAADGQSRRVEREALHALRNLASGVRAVGQTEGSGPTAYAQLIGRVLSRAASRAREPLPEQASSDTGSGLILPPD